MKLSIKGSIRWISVAVLAAALATSGCAWLRYRAAESPSVALERAELVAFSMSAQRFDLTLRVHNPNGFALPLSSLEYRLQVDDKPVASGQSTRAVTIPADGAATVPVTVEANLIESGVIKSFEQVQAWRDAGAARFDYDLAGSVRLADIDGALPFRKSGQVRVDLSDW